MSTCLTCDGTGVIIICCDDLCANSDHCIHGDGEEMCPDCKGEGEIFDDYDEYYEYYEPDEFDEPTEDEEQRIADEEYEHNHGVCCTCCGEWYEGWSSCFCGE